MSRTEILNSFKMHTAERKWVSPIPHGEEIVVSGISGRFPQSNNINEFAVNLFNKNDLTTVTKDSWRHSHSKIPKRMGKIQNTDKFDAGYFGVHHRQANSMSPAIRKVLETVMEAIIDAGINPSELEGTRTGVFLGLCFNEMEIQATKNTTKSQSFAATGHFRSFFAHRISFYLKLKGPSFVVDTACSSSAHALEAAYSFMRSGRCDNAVVASVHLLEHPGITLQFCRLGLLSDDGICRVFDQDAKGYVRAEAAACVFLQKLKNARRNYGEIIHCKVNSDGFKEQGVSYPSTKAQQQLLIEILDESQIDPNQISFLEAHGTGTQVGDPEEIEAIDSAIAKKRSKPLLIGSVKCNTGHTEAASGLVSLVKLIICAEKGYIFPNIHLTRIKNGLVGLEQGRMKVVTETTKLECDDAVFAMNHVGFGGSNAHVLMRRFSKGKELKVSEDDIPRLVCVSGRTKESVLILLNDLNERSIDVEYIGLLHQIFKINLDQHIYRGFTIVTKNGSVATSSKFCNKKSIDSCVFFGNIKGSYRSLAQQLLVFAHFKATIEKLQTLLIKQGVDIFEAISSNVAKKESQIFGAFAVDVGIAGLLKLLEIKAKIMYQDPVGKLIRDLYYEEIGLEEAVLKVLENIYLLDIETLPKNNESNIQDQNGKNGHDQSLVQTSNINFPYKTSKKAKVLHICDQQAVSNDNVIDLKDNFLVTLGKLYEAGLNPQIHKLYPQIQFPVSRNTPMISPLIKWNYNKSWYTYEFVGFGGSETLQQYKISYSLNKEYEYIKGHVVNGYNLIPVTEYLYLVWQTLARSERLLPAEVPVVFENCKFVKSVEMLKTDAVELVVSIHLGSGNFEVTETNSIVAIGNIKKLTKKENHFTDLVAISMPKDAKEVLQYNEIYRELNLRGYNYSGLFKGIKKCSVDASVGLVQWEDNWTAFIDKMLQLNALQIDTKLTLVPASIRKLTIDPQHHLNVAEAQKEMLCSVCCYKNLNIIKSCGIEISGLRSSISVRKLTQKPVLEKQVFVPNILLTNLEYSVRINVEIVLENILKNHLKAVEIVDEFTTPRSTLILPIVDKVAKKFPMVTTDLAISTHSVLSQISDIKTTNFLFTPESNLSLIVGTKLLQRQRVELLEHISKSLISSGFIMTREDKNFVFEHFENLEVFTEHVTGDEKVFLLKRSNLLSTIKVIQASSDHFEWLPELQKILKSEQSVVVWSKNELDGILGLINCLICEPGGNKLQCFFMMDIAPDFDLQDPFYQIQLNKKMTVNIYRNGCWGTYRHFPLEDQPKVVSPHCYASVTIEDGLFNVQWLEGPLNEASKLERSISLVYPYYAAINFKDVMVASGQISTDAAATKRIERKCLQGFEFCGRDVKGRRVMGMTNSQAIATMASANTTFLWEVPKKWSLEEASTVPVAYVNVVYALFKVIKFKPRKYILIHSATDDIGMAALNICLHHGCHVFLTVDTQEKRDYLHKHFSQVPVNHIGNSTKTSFEEMVKIGTNGRGVDIILNSLSGEKLEATIRCLARGGDFVDIGVFDLENDTSLNLLLMEKCVNYHGVVLNRIIMQSAPVKQWIVNKIYEGINKGYVKPLPRKIFNHSEVVKAFQCLTLGNHIGKVIVKVRDEMESTELPKATLRFNCNSEKTYIIIGGLGGVGLELADWLFLRGAKKLILVSRCGIQTGYQTRKIRNWTASGVTIIVSTLDVTTEQGCVDLIKKASELGPVDGIFNLAAVLKDALFKDQTKETFITSLAPKARVTTHLDQVSRAYCADLRYFVVFSSGSCGRGNAGQSNYGMANSVMERVCEKRKREGFPAVAIQWGAIGDVGLTMRMQEVYSHKEFVIGGTIQQNMSSCLKVLDQLLMQDGAVVGSIVVAEKSKSSESAAVAIGHVLGIRDLKTVSPHATFTELGMDSITAAEAVEILAKDFDIHVALKEIRNLTFAKLLINNKN